MEERAIHISSVKEKIEEKTDLVILQSSLIHLWSFPFTFEPRRPLFCPVSSTNIAEMRIYVTDSLGRPVNFNGIDWFMTLILHSM